MKKKVVIILGIVLLICLSLYFYNSNSNNQTTKSLILNTPKEQIIPTSSNKYVEEVNSFSTQVSNTKKQITSDQEYFMSEDKFNSIMEKSAKNNGVSYISLSELDTKSRKEAEEALKNLTEKGSLSGGVKQQEFAEIEKSRDTLREEGIENIKSKLDGFNGINDSILNTYDLRLTGAQTFGRYDSNNGWDSLYKLYENTNQKIEVEQTFLKANESAHQFITESLNIELNNNTPARYEKLPSDLIEKLTFVYNSNYYQINGQHLKKDQLVNIANKIIDSK